MDGRVVCPGPGPGPGPGLGSKPSMNNASNPMSYVPERERESHVKSRAKSVKSTVIGGSGECEQLVDCRESEKEGQQWWWSLLLLLTRRLLSEEESPACTLPLSLPKNFLKIYLSFVLIFPSCQMNFEFNLEIFFFCFSLMHSIFVFGMRLPHSH